MGKEGTGIAKPIEAVVRKGKGAIGAYGSERPAGERVYEEEENEEGGKRVSIKHKKQWRKKDGAAAPSYQFKTVEEVLEEKNQKVAGGWDTSELSKVKVIDMTGKETRVLSGTRVNQPQNFRVQFPLPCPSSVRLPCDAHNSHRTRRGRRDAAGL